MKPIFSCFFPFQIRFRGIFRWHVTLFSPKLQFFLASSCTSPYFGHFFKRSHPLLSPHFSFCTARILFRFGFSLSSSSTPPSYFPLISFPPFIPPPSSLTPPLSFSFLPTFPPPSPINTRTCAPSRNTRVRVRPHLPARQEVFVFILHRFTPPRNPLCTNALGVKEN